MNLTTYKRQLRTTQHLLALQNGNYKQAIKNFSHNDKQVMRTAIAFTCECSNVDCSLPIYISIDAYEQIHNSRGKHIVKPGHQNSAIEIIVRRSKSYFVVRKLPHYMQWLPKSLIT